MSIRTPGRCSLSQCRCAADEVGQYNHAGRPLAAYQPAVLSAGESPAQLYGVIYLCVGCEFGAALWSHPRSLMQYVVASLNCQRQQSVFSNTTFSCSDCNPTDLAATLHCTDCTLAAPLLCDLLELRKMPQHVLGATA